MLFTPIKIYGWDTRDLPRFVNRHKLSKKFIKQVIQKDPSLIHYILDNPYLSKEEKEDLSKILKTIKK